MQVNFDGVTYFYTSMMLWIDLTSEIYKIIILLYPLKSDVRSKN